MAAGLLTIAEASQALRLSDRSVRRLIASGELDAVRPTPRTPRIWASSVTAPLARDYQPRQAESEAA